MTDPMPYRCPAIEPGMGLLERCILNVGHGGGFHMAAGAWPVEGSTPIAPALADGAIVHRCPPSGSSVMPCCGRTPFEARGDRITVDPALVTCVAPAGEVVSVPEGWTRGLGESQDWDNGDVVVSAPPPAPARADEPVPVPPPVDALLKLVDEFGREAHAYGLGDDSFGDTMTDSWKEINSRVRALWAAGVEEGRQQLDEVQKLAALHGYELGVAEGRRQATEERTEEQPVEPRVNVDGIVPRVCVHCGGEIFMHGWWRHLATVRRDCPSGETRAEPPLAVRRG